MDEGADWVGEGPSGKIILGGSACPDTGDPIVFTMRYLRDPRRDYGPYLALDVNHAQLKSAVAGHVVHVTGTVTANHPADLTVSVLDADGKALLLAPGTRVGSRTLHGHARAFSSPAGGSTTITFELALPISEVTPNVD
jgi:hypothetical protein